MFIFLVFISFMLHFQGTKNINWGLGEKAARRDVIFGPLFACFSGFLMMLQHGVQGKNKKGRKRNEEIDAFAFGDGVRAGKSGPSPTRGGPLFHRCCSDKVV